MKNKEFPSTKTVIWHFVLIKTFSLKYLIKKISNKTVMLIIFWLAMGISQRVDIIHDYPRQNQDILLIKEKQKNEEKQKCFLLCASTVYAELIIPISFAFLQYLRSSELCGKLAVFSLSK